MRFRWFVLVRQGVFLVKAPPHPVNVITDKPLTPRGGSNPNVQRRTHAPLPPPTHTHSYPHTHSLSLSVSGARYLCLLNHARPLSHRRHTSARGNPQPATKHVTSRSRSRVGGPNTARPMAATSLAARFPLTSRCSTSRAGRPVRSVAAHLGCELPPPFDPPPPPSPGTRTGRRTERTRLGVGNVRWLGIRCVTYRGRNIPNRLQRWPHTVWPVHRRANVPAVCKRLLERSRRRYRSATHSIRDTASAPTTAGARLRRRRRGPSRLGPDGCPGRYAPATPPLSRRPLRRPGLQRRVEGPQPRGTPPQGLRHRFGGVHPQTDRAPRCARKAEMPTAARLPLRSLGVIHAGEGEAPGQTACAGCVPMPRTAASTAAACVSASAPSAGPSGSARRWWGSHSHRAQRASGWSVTPASSAVTGSHAITAARRRRQRAPGTGPHAPGRSGTRSEPIRRPTPR
jgi:hypothetical protein